MLAMVIAGFAANILHQNDVYNALQGAVGPLTTIATRTETELN